jgi:hypothetical protein
MAGFPRARSRPLLTVYLIIALLAVFLFAAVEPIRSLEFEKPEPIGLSYTSPIISISYLAVLPNTSQNAGESASSLRAGALRFLILFGMYAIIAAFFKSLSLEKTQANPADVKNSILLKLRI